MTILGRILATVRRPKCFVSAHSAYAVPFPPVSSLKFMRVPSEQQRGVFLTAERVLTGRRARWCSAGADLRVPRETGMRLILPSSCLCSQQCTVQRYADVTQCLRGKEPCCLMPVLERRSTSPAYPASPTPSHTCRTSLALTLTCALPSLRLCCPVPTSVGAPAAALAAGAQCADLASLCASACPAAPGPLVSHHMIIACGRRSPSAWVLYRPSVASQQAPASLAEQRIIESRGDARWAARIALHGRQTSGRQLRVAPCRCLVHEAVASARLLQSTDADVQPKDRG